MKTAPLSVSSEDGNPQLAAAAWKLATTSAALNTLRASDGHQEPGVIVDHVQDLDLGPVGEAPMGDVGLPPLVRHRSLEPDEGAPGSFLGLRVTNPRREGSARSSRPKAVAARDAAQVDSDRVGTGIDAEVGQLLAELDDLVLELLGRPCGLLGDGEIAAPGPLPFGIEPPTELVDPPPGHPVVPGHLGLRPSLDPDRRDHEPRQRHRPPLRPEV